MKKFTIAGHSVGADAEPLLWFDIGTFFNQDMSEAENLVRGLKAAGASFVKGEVLHSIDICLDVDDHESYYSAENGTTIKERWRDIIERKVISLDAYRALFKLCHELEMELVLSVYDFAGADFAKEVGAAAIKIASSNIVHQPLIEHVAQLGLPMVLDTGRADMEEISRGVLWARDAGAEQLIIQHSPKAPPSPVSEHHLRMLHTLGDMFGAPVGLSDHHAGDEMLYAASALGVAVLEKGVCPVGAETDLDVSHALPINLAGQVIEKCRNIHQALGSTMRYLPRERERYNQRMGLVAARDLGCGDVLDLESASFAFPPLGIGVEHWAQVCGVKLNKPLSAGQVISWADLELPTS